MRLQLQATRGIESRDEQSKFDSVTRPWANFGQPHLQRVNDHVYSAIGYAISNVIYVLTSESVVVIDTTESMKSARASLEEFRKVSSLPVSHIIYTHFHGDHIRGARVFHEPTTRVIAQRRLPEEVAYVERMLPYRKRVTSLQFGFQLRPEQRGAAIVGERENGYVAPDILFDEDYSFREGGLTFELYHTQGETADHLMAWIPELGTLFPGDLFYAQFPMLSNPMRTDRPVLAWAESLERMREFQPRHLVPSHGKPIGGVEEIELVLSNYARAIRHVHDETIRLINDGLPLEKIRTQVSLPKDLASLPYLQEGYGKVAWSVNGIFRQHTGWYGFDPAELNPGPRIEFRAALIEAMGGPAALVEQARKVLHEGRHQLALELADVVLGARPLHLGAKAVRLRALRSLANASANGVEQNVYRTAAKQALCAFDPLPEEGFSTNRLHYSGIWTRAETETSGPSRDSTVTFELATSHLRERTAAAVNRWYDERMFAAWATRKYASSDFHNYGYWTDETRSPKEACEKLMEALLAFVPDKSGNILDIACGKGATTRYLLKCFNPEDIIGINISEKQLERCRLNAPKCKFMNMNATNMTFKDASFDHLICVEAANHFVPRARFFSEAYRILRPGGRLVLSDAIPSARPAGGNLIQPQHTWVSPVEYRNLYLNAGFGRVEIVDATRECIDGCRRHAFRLLRNKWLSEKIDLATFRAGRARIIQKERKKGYYLLVCAQKGESQSSPRHASAVENG
jgi:glyoxylase-like metal-dependent hydrolase (beta-lactamase superfamily II)/ubiquinone/menaquinone biosynthesis C-methylase UbiE